MKVFITGGSGFIGSHLVNCCLDKKWSVHVLSHKSSIPREKECQVYSGDICDFSFLKKALWGKEVLIHSAAALGSSIRDKREFFRVNSEGTQTLFKAAWEAGIKKIIHFSSAGVLGAVRKGDIAAEDYPLNPQTSYDQSKLEGEYVALEWAQRGMNVIVVRPGWVYGPGDNRTFKLIKAIARNRFILVTRGEATQTPVYIDDLVQGIFLSLDKGRPGETYHLAGAEVVKVKEMVETIAWATKTKLPPFSLPLWPVKQSALILEKLFYLLKKEPPLSSSQLSFFLHPKPLSIHKACRELGYHPQFNFRQGMLHSVKWYHHQGWL